MTYIKYPSISANCRVFIINSGVTDRHVVTCKLSHLCAKIYVLLSKGGILHLIILSRKNKGYLSEQGFMGWLGLTGLSLNLDW